MEAARDAAIAFVEAEGAPAALDLATRVDRRQTRLDAFD
jgi:hypothetical protein